jgi:hypothetical protein
MKSLTQSNSRMSLPIRPWLWLRFSQSIGFGVGVRPDKSFFGSAQLQHAQCVPLIKRTCKCSQPRLVSRGRRVLAQLCASSRFI